MTNQPRLYINFYLLFAAGGAFILALGLGMSVDVLTVGRPIGIVIGMLFVYIGREVIYLTWPMFKDDYVLSDEDFVIPEPVVKIVVIGARQRVAHSTEGYVYLLHALFSANYKIGRTSDPDDRLRTFNVKLPFEVEYITVIKTLDMYQLERELHLKFQNKRTKGEWFNLSADDVEYIKNLVSVPQVIPECGSLVCLTPAYRTWYSKTHQQAWPLAHGIVFTVTKVTDSQIELHNGIVLVTVPMEAISQHVSLIG